jgi:hypothetical protein
MIRPSPLRSEQNDSTYMGMTPTLYLSSMQEYLPLASLIGSDGFLCLQSPPSDQGLIVIWKRLEQLSGMMQA